MSLPPTGLKPMTVWSHRQSPYSQSHTQCMIMIHKIWVLFFSCPPCSSRYCRGLPDPAPCPVCALVQGPHLLWLLWGDAVGSSSPGSQMWRWVQDPGPLAMQPTYMDTHIDVYRYTHMQTKQQGYLCTKERVVGALASVHMTVVMETNAASEYTRTGSLATVYGTARGQQPPQKFTRRLQEKAAVTFLDSALGMGAVGGGRRQHMALNCRVPPPSVRLPAITERGLWSPNLDLWMESSVRRQSPHGIFKRLLWNRAEQCHVLPLFPPQKAGRAEGQGCII